MKTAVALASLVMSAGLACGQVILEPKPGEFLKPSEWQPHPLAQVGKSQQWLVSIRFRLTSREPSHEVDRCYCCADPAAIEHLNDPKNLFMDSCDDDPKRQRVQVRRQWITLPFIERGVFQDADLRSLESTLQLDREMYDVPTRPLASVPSMQREIGWLVDAGPDDSFGWKCAEVNLRFITTLREMKYRREQLARFPKPKKWPDEAMGAFEPQAYIDFAPQANGFVQPIDDRRIIEMVGQIANRAKINPTNAPVPSELAYRFASVVFDAIRNREDTLTPWSADEGRAAPYRQVVESGKPRPSLPGTFHPHVDPDTFYGIPVRDILNVWNEGVGTEPERCAVLVAALRKFNIPARLVIGVELDEPDIDEAFNPRSGYRRTETTTVLPGHPATGPDDPNCPNMPAVPERTLYEGFMSSRPATVVAWVEFATFDPELKQLIWVPIDPGSGGNSWKFGTLDNSESIVALATNFWPKDVQFVGREYESLVRFGTQWKYWKPGVADWNLPASLFGMQSSPKVYSACCMEWRVTGRKASQREMNEFRSVERVPYTKERVLDDSNAAAATPNAAKSAGASQNDKSQTPAAPAPKPTPTKKPGK